MTTLKGFGLEIYRAKEEKAENEFILYNSTEKTFTQLNNTRLKQIIVIELRDMGIDIYEYVYSELKFDRNTKFNDILGGIIIQEVILINKIGFKPIKEIIFIKEDKKYFNTYKLIETLNNENYNLEKSFSFQEFKIKANNIYKLLYNLHNKDDNAIKDTLMKIADKLKYPAEKSQDCIIFYPGEAAGKGIFYKHIIKPIFQQYTKKILMKKLNNDFNAFLPELLVLVLEEGKRDLELVETLKETITEGSTLINEKGKNQYESDVYFLNFVFSNQMNPIDLGKRRGSYHLTHSLGKNLDESQKIGCKLCEKIPKELPILLQYLHNLDFNHQQALKPYHTKAKMDVNELNKTPVELFYDYICSFESLEYAFKNLNTRNYNNSNNYNIQNHLGIVYIAKDDFKNAYNNFCQIEGLKNNIIRHNKDIVQLWDLFKLNDEDIIRLIIKDINNKSRRIDHVSLTKIEKHIKEVYKNE